MREAIKADDSTYYEYALLYYDDVLVIGEHGEICIREEIGKYFVL